MSEKAGWGNTRSLFLLICLISFSFLASGQRGGSQNEIHKLISGVIPVLSQNWEICRDPLSGYIYFANSAGLIEYNGITARTYTVPTRQGVRSVYVNNDGMIFTGSFEDFGIWAKDKSGRLSYTSLEEGTVISKNDEIWNIYELDHNIYFQSFTAVYIFDYNVVRKVETPSFMLFFFRVGDRFMAQALGHGLYWFDGTDFTFIEGSEPFGSLKVHALIDFGPDDQWVCTANDGIFAYDGINFTPLDTEISLYLKEATCNAGLAANDNMIVFGTILKGVAICDRSGRILETYDYSNGLNNNTVLSLYLDDTDGIWAGLDDGANYILTSSHVTYYANTSGALGTIYTAIRDQDHLYLGTNHGLFAANISPVDGNYRFSDLRIIPNTQGQVWKLAQYDGQILCGHNDGTFVIEGGRAEKISDVTGGWSFKPYGDFLLEGTYTGIVSFGKDASGKWVYRNRIEGYIEPTRFLEIDYLGYVWAVHPQKGIYRLELNEQADSIVSSLYFSLLADSSKILSMSSLNNQVVFMASDHIFAFDYEKRDFFPVTSLEQGLDEFVGATQIIGYRGNSYWFVLDNRIALFNVSRDLQAEKVLEFVHEYADLPWREQQIISLDSARLLIPTRQAFSIYDIEKLSDDGPGSALNFSRLIFSGGNKSTTLFPGATENLSVSSRKNNLTVHIANPSGFDSEGREYLYRITELGDDWYRTVADNFSLLNLRHGEYHLQVREPGGNDLVEARFVIRRPFLLTGWAWVLYVLIVAGLIAVAVRLFRMTLERHRRMIEYEVGKNRLESELDYKSYELMLTMRYLIRKTDTLRELRDRLESVKESSSKLPARFVREMEQIIDHGLDTQTEEWQNVMKNLKFSQEGFFSKMKKKYPSLTPNDLRLCSYLRMNFTTKEIANLSNISTRAVEIGRYRLRTKLKLSHDVNLTEFLIREAETTD